jgi:hypothetical protein
MQEIDLLQDVRWILHGIDLPEQYNILSPNDVKPERVFSILLAHNYPLNS